MSDRSTVNIDCNVNTNSVDFVVVCWSSYWDEVFVSTFES
jgi:hypothetical protein